jgi:hypothetical protein
MHAAAISSFSQGFFHSIAKLSTPVPRRERSSGILRGTKRISKRGRPLLRQAAYMFAVRSITKGGLFRAEYEALCERNGGKKMKAVVAVMRSGLRPVYSVARDRRMFTAEAPVWRDRPARRVATA